MSLGSYNAVSVGTTPTLLIPANVERKGFILFNNGTSVLYIGPDANITSSNAIPILPSDSADLIGIFEAFRGSVYGVSASATIDARYWEWI